MGTTNEWFISASDKENPKIKYGKGGKVDPHDVQLDTDLTHILNWVTDSGFAVEGSDHYYLVTEPGNLSSIPPVTLIENMTYCFNEDLSAYIRLTNQED